MELWTRSRRQEATVLKRQLPEKLPIPGKAVLVVEGVQRIPAATSLCSSPVARHFFYLSYFIQDIASLQAGIEMRQKLKS